VSGGQRDASPALAHARAALRGSRCWVVGGAVRDRLRGVERIDDVDIVLDGDVRGAARAAAQHAGAACFPLSQRFGAWRVIARGGDWQLDVNPLRGGSIDADLALRDFTVNAIAEPLEGGALVDPLGGVEDLRRGVLRLAGPLSLAEDPLRVVRLVRLACELRLEPDAPTAAAARAAAAGLRHSAAERVYGELARIIASERPAAGMRTLVELGASAVVLPELDALGGVEQSRYHHLDVLEHTLEVLDATVRLEGDLAGLFGETHAQALADVLAEPLGDGLTRAVGLRFGALLHDIAKPATRTLLADGRIAFPGHDTLGAQLAHAILTRLRAAERVSSHVAALTREHLRLGFLVHRAPLAAGELYGYLDACGERVVDVTLLSVADRLATRGAKAEAAIERHLELARSIIGEALRWQRSGPPRPPIRGDELARALSLVPGPLIGRLLSAIAQQQYAGTVRTREDAIEFARREIA
jgi:poly(A) polymerase